MAGEQGYLYEKKCNTLLDKAGLLPKSLNLYGGSNNTVPDGEFKYKVNQRYVNFKIEYKLDITADLGQASLDYNMKTKKWIITGKNTPEAIEIQKLMIAAGVETMINSAEGWGSLGPPNKYKVSAVDKKTKVTKKQAEDDYKNFSNKFIVIKKGAVNKYYAAKHNYYIQIGEKGFYYMQSNPADLDIPRFNPDLRVRVRLKAGGSGLQGSDYWNYRFSVALQAVNAKQIPKSSHSLDTSVVFLIS